MLHNTALEGAKFRHDDNEDNDDDDGGINRSSDGNRDHTSDLHSQEVTDWSVFIHEPI